MGAIHQNPPNMVLKVALCLVCNTNLKYCGWCPKCKEQWPKSNQNQEDNMDERVRELERRLENGDLDAYKEWVLNARCRVGEHLWSSEAPYSVDWSPLHSDESDKFKFKLLRTAAESGPHYFHREGSPEFTIKECFFCGKTVREMTLYTQKVKLPEKVGDNAWTLGWTDYELFKTFEFGD